MIHRSSSPDFSDGDALDATTATSYTDRTPIGGTTNYYKIVAIDEQSSQQISTCIFGNDIIGVLDSCFSLIVRVAGTGNNRAFADLGAITEDIVLIIATARSIPTEIYSTAIAATVQSGAASITLSGNGQYDSSGTLNAVQLQWTPAEGEHPLYMIHRSSSPDFSDGDAFTGRSRAGTTTGH